MAQQTIADGSGQETLPPEIESVLDNTNSSVLEERVRELYAAMVDNETVEQSMSLEWTEVTDGHDFFNLVIEPEENWTKEGQLGLDQFHIILGPRGGIQTARKDSVFTEAVDYSDKRHAYERIKSMVSRMS